MSAALPHPRLVATTASYDDMADKAPCGLAVLDKHGFIQALNERFLTLAGVNADGLLGRRMVEILAPGSRVLFEAQFGPLLLIQGQVAEIALDIARPDGARLPILLNAAVDRSDSGEEPTIRVALIEAKDRRRYETELLAERRRAQNLSEQLNDVLESTTDAVLAVDRTWRLTFANRHAHQLFDRMRLAAGCSFLTAFEAIAGISASVQLQACVAAGVPTTLDIYLPDGGRWLDCHLYPGLDGARFFLRDVTERRKAEDKLRIAHAEAAHRATHDALTGLKNRAAFTEAVEARLSRREPIIVALIDLDRFKPVNDTYGHAVGDRLLQAVAGRIRGGVRPGDFAARLGGDEFAVIIEPQSGGREGAVEFAARLRNAISAVYSIDGHTITIGASIGISMSPEHGVSIGELYHHADLALYRVKHSGRNAVCVFDAVLRQELEEQESLGEDLRRALAEGKPSIFLVDGTAINGDATVGSVIAMSWSDPRHGRFGVREIQRVVCAAGFAHELSRYFADALGRLALECSATPFIALPIHVSSLMNHLEADLLRVTNESSLDPSRLRLIMTDDAIPIDQASLRDQLGVLKTLGYPVDLGGFPAPDCALAILKVFAFDAVWTDLDPADLAPNDVRSLALEAASRCGLPVFRTSPPSL